MPLKHLALLIAVMMASACTSKTGDETPVKTLETYIEASFNVRGVEDKQKMEDLLTGDTKNRLTAWSDEQFLKAFVETKKKFSSLKILENKKVSDDETALTYDLSYQEGEGDKMAQITQRKLCTLVKKDGGWRIKEVRSLRESIEYLKELSLP